MNIEREVRALNRKIASARREIESAYADDWGSEPQECAFYVGQLEERIGIYQRQIESYRSAEYRAQIAADDDDLRTLNY